MRQIRIPAVAKFIALPVRHRHLRILLRYRVPQAFDKLKTFSAYEFEEPCKFCVYRHERWVFQRDATVHAPKYNGPGDGERNTLLTSVLYHCASCGAAAA